MLYLAVLGFMAAIVAEFSTGQSLFSQVVTGGGVKALFVIGVVIAASFAPAIRQVSRERAAVPALAVSDSNNRALFLSCIGLWSCSLRV